MNASPRVAGLVLAAGAGSRFGDAPKQLAPLDGRPLLEHALAALAAVPRLAPRAVTLGAHADLIERQVDLHGARPIHVERWEEGQAASLRAGVAALAAADAILVVLGDQPRLTPATIVRVLDAWDGTARPVRAVWDGRPGHPVLLPRALYAGVATLRGDVGARALLDAADVREVACGAGAVRDVDTPSQLAALRAERR